MLQIHNVHKIPLLTLHTVKKNKKRHDNHIDIYRDTSWNSRNRGGCHRRLDNNKNKINNETYAIS